MSSIVVHFDQRLELFSEFFLQKSKKFAANFCKKQSTDQRFGTNSKKTYFFRPKRWSKYSTNNWFRGRGSHTPVYGTDLQSGFCLHPLAIVWQTGWTCFPPMTSLSGGCWAQTGWRSDCARRHCSSGLGVFLQQNQSPVVNLLDVSSHR